MSIIPEHLRSPSLSVIVRFTQYLVSSIVFCRSLFLFFFFLTIVSYVLLNCTASDYSFGIFIDHIKNYNYWSYYIMILFKQFYWLSCCHLTFRKIWYCLIKTLIDLVSLSLFVLLNCTASDYSFGIFIFFLNYRFQISYRVWLYYWCLLETGTLLNTRHSILKNGQQEPYKTLYTGN
jgi:hypothetical protein